MDKLYIALLVLLGISIIFLGLSVILKDNQTLPLISETNNEEEVEEGVEREVWSTEITPKHMVTIISLAYLSRLRDADNSGDIEGTELLCLNVCGDRCVYLGYTYKDSSPLPGRYLYSNNENPICSCDCYVH